MNVRKLVSPLLALLLLASLGGPAGWLGWRWYTTPVVPNHLAEDADQEVAEAVADASQEVRREPRSGAAWGKLGMVLAINGYTEQGTRCFVHAQRFDPHNPRWPYLRGVLLLNGSPSEAIPLLLQAQAVAETTQHRAAIHFRLAVALLEEGQLDLSEQQIHGLRQMEPDGPRLHLALGLLAMARQDRDKARQHLSRLTENPFARRRACSLLATLLAADRKAARVYEDSSANLPEDFPWPDPFLLEMNRWKVHQTSRLATVDQLESQGRSAEALHFLRRLVAQSPDAEVCLVLGQRLLERNEAEEAEALFRAVVRLEPQNVPAHYFLGEALLKQGEKRSREAGLTAPARELFRQAVAAEDEALARQRNHADAHLIRARAFQRLGRTADSLQALRQALLCRSESARIHLALGEALAQAGQLPEALEHLENAVRLAGPDDPLPRETLKRWQTKVKP